MRRLILCRIPLEVVEVAFTVVREEGVFAKAVDPEAVGAAVAAVVFVTVLFVSGFGPASVVTDVGMKATLKVRLGLLAALIRT